MDVNSCMTDYQRSALCYTPHVIRCTRLYFEEFNAQTWQFVIGSLQE